MIIYTVYNASARLSEGCVVRFPLGHRSGLSQQVITGLLEQI
jgi:hypothetical protein